MTTCKCGACNPDVVLEHALDTIEDLEKENKQLRDALRYMMRLYLVPDDYMYEDEIEASLEYHYQELLERFL